MFALVVRFELKDDAAAAAFDGLVSELLVHIRANEPGTLLYAVHPVQDAPLSRLFYEVYADRAAFETHEQNPPVRRFLAARGEHLSSFRVEFLGDATGKGVPAA